MFRGNSAYLVSKKIITYIILYFFHIKCNPSDSILPQMFSNYPKRWMTYYFPLIFFIWCHIIKCLFLLFSCAQLCSTICNPLDCSPPSSSDHGIFQARILEWVAVSFSRGSSQPRDQTCNSCVSCVAGSFFTHWAVGA